MAAGTLAPRRLADFMKQTHRYRIGMMGVTTAWYLAVVILGLEIESGAPGTTQLGIMIAVFSATILAMPSITRWVIRRGRPAEHAYALVLLADGLLVAGGVYLTGGRISIAFIMYYIMAIGNCYMLNGRGTFLANTFLGVSYTGTLLLMELLGHPYAPTPLDWLDILLVRIPLIYLISAYARWLARRGDRLVLEDQATYLETLKGFLSALEARDGYTMRHSRNVGYWSAALARSLGAGEEELQVLIHAGELHDIGKIGIPDSVLNKPGRLSPDEQRRMQEHPLIGVRITQHLKWITPEHLGIIRHHHERWDGTGYPDRRSGTQIPYLARLAAVCDAYDALTDDRPYRRAIPVSKALEILAAGKGTQFDPVLLPAFLGLIANLQLVLARHLTVLECWTTTWSETGAVIRVDTPDGPVLASLTYSVSGWTWLGCEPLGAPDVDTPSIAATS